MSTLRTILCADWSKHPHRRAVYIADLTARTVSRLHSATGWTLAEVLHHANQNTPSLATFDLPLGVPQSYLKAAGFESFIHLLRYAAANPAYFEATHSAANWTPHRPFFAVPKGKGGLTSYSNAAEHFGVNLYRAIDRPTKAKTAFAKSGIPGSVGSAACAFWQELAPLLTPNRKFHLWPFEGDNLESPAITITEIYPRAAYATALLNQPPESRPPLFLAKTNPAVRHSAIQHLRNAAWVKSHQVTLGDLNQAHHSEDDFDACLTAAALLRCHLDQLPFHSPLNPTDRIEGTILGTATINLSLKECRQ